MYQGRRITGKGESTLNRSKGTSSMRNSGTPIVWDFARALIKDVTWDDNQRNYSRRPSLQLSFLPCSMEGHVLEAAKGQDA